MIMVLVIDNFDSFTYNLVGYLRELGIDTQVLRNDASIEAIQKMNPEHILLSPGPGNPDSSGVSLEALRLYHRNRRVFGVCLGHQIIGQFFGARIVRAKQPMHGKICKVYHDGKSVFDGLPSPYWITRYHSLIIERETLPACLEISAETGDGEIMGVRHKEYDVEGVQFHPESITTEHGHALLRNFFLKSIHKVNL
jgi:para-aminobenzoate synthetase component II